LHLVERKKFFGKTIFYEEYIFLYHLTPKGKPGLSPGFPFLDGARGESLHASNDWSMFIEGRGKDEA
jgi:hypothetical protein